MAGQPGRSGGTRSGSGRKSPWKKGKITRMAVPRDLADILKKIAIALQDGDIQAAHDHLQAFDASRGSAGEPDEPDWKH